MQVPYYDSKLENKSHIIVIEVIIKSILLITLLDKALPDLIGDVLKIIIYHLWQHNCKSTSHVHTCITV